MIDSGERLSLVAGERRSIEPPALRIVYTRGAEGRGTSPCPRKFLSNFAWSLYSGSPRKFLSNFAWSLYSGSPRNFFLCNFLRSLYRVPLNTNTMSFKKKDQEAIAKLVMEMNKPYHQPVTGRVEIGNI